jgi:hypothetical protein
MEVISRRWYHTSIPHVNNLPAELIDGKAGIPFIRR